MMATATCKSEGCGNLAWSPHFFGRCERCGLAWAEESGKLVRDGKGRLRPLGYPAGKKLTAAVWDAWARETLKEGDTG